LIREFSAHICFREAGELRHFLVFAFIGAAVYFFGNWAGIAGLIALGAILTSHAILYYYYGWQLLKKAWFPVLYTFFIVPPPITLTGPFIQAARLSISNSAVDLLLPLGYDVANSGVSLYIDQYEVAVAAACAGLNSIVSLQAIGLLYIFLFRRADWKYCIILAMAIFPIAILANFTRVIMLLLATHYFGENFAQGIFHEAAGLTMFVVTLMFLVLFDRMIAPLYTRLNRICSTNA